MSPWLAFWFASPRLVRAAGAGRMCPCLADRCAVPWLRVEVAVRGFGGSYGSMPCALRCAAAGVHAGWAFCSVMFCPRGRPFCVAVCACRGGPGGGGWMSAARGGIWASRVRCVIGMAGRPGGGAVHVSSPRGAGLCLGGRRWMSAPWGGMWPPSRCAVSAWRASLSGWCRQVPVPRCAAWRGGLMAELRAASECGPQSHRHPQYAQ